jgi:hypothetical protein
MACPQLRQAPERLETYRRDLFFDHPLFIRTSYRVGSTTAVAIPILESSQMMKIKVSS